MAYANVNGTRLWYEEEAGAPGRPTLLLLHAALQTAESMEPLRQLARPLGFRIVTVDQRGHGRSANPGRSLTIPQLADDMEQLMLQLAMERPVVAGYSLGGIVGLELACRGALSSLIVLASRIHTATRARMAFSPEGIRQRSPQWAEQLAQKHQEIPWEELAEELGLLLESWPGLPGERLAAVQAPLLVVQGDQDLMVPVEQAEELAATVPGATLRVIPRAGHPELLYRSDAMKAVGEFLALRSHSPGGNRWGE